MSTLQKDIDRAMSNKAALVQITNTFGWKLVKEIADKVVEVSIQAALDEEDRDKGESKRLKASALKKGFADLFNTIESAKQFNLTQTDEDSGFGQLEYSSAKEQKN